MTLLKRKYYFLLLLLMVGVTVGAQNKPEMFTENLKAALRGQVKEATRHAWSGYKQYAWNFDDLQPLTKNGKNWYKHSMLMTPVDAYDCLLMLGLKEEAGEAKEIILKNLNFNVDNEVQVFEVTIRLLGGLITAYELDGDERFLTLATDLADRLMPAFNTPTGMPYRYVHLQTGKLRDSINNPAEIGTLLLEFGQLSKYTGNDRYYKAAKRAIMNLYALRSKLDLAGERVNVTTGQWVSTRSHISGYIDSYYEYLYKGWLLFGDKEFKRAFEKHARAIKKHLLSKTKNGSFLRVVDMHTGKELATTYGALDAFYAGLASFSGDVPMAKDIQDANYYMWTRFGIEPEEFNFKTDSITSAGYILRPENIESCFYLYRSTRDDKYLWMGKTMLEDILTHCRTPEAFAGLRDVRTKEKSNSMQSFFFAETLKYAYLLFAEPGEFNLKKAVFNTEAHPFKILTKKK